jgi:hypothetical protein
MTHSEAVHKALVVYRRRALGSGKAKPSSVVECIEVSMPSWCLKANGRMTGSEKKAVKRLSVRQNELLQRIALARDFPNATGESVTVGEALDAFMESEAKVAGRGRSGRITL